MATEAGIPCPRKGNCEMNRSAFNIGITDVLLLLIAAAFLPGVLFVFHPCLPNADGSWMTCHWAGNAVAGLAGVLVVISAAHLLVRGDQVKLGLSLAVVPVALLACLVPENVIHMCMMRSMRCHTVMRPAVIVCAALMIAAAVADILARRKRVGS